MGPTPPYAEAVPRPWPAAAPSAEDRGAFADAVPRSPWLDALPPTPPAPGPGAPIEADLCIIGGGFTGLWAALHAKADDPDRDVVLLEGGRTGEAASGRNGGFCVASLTHGLGNGLARFPGELATLERLGLENHAGLVADLRRLGIDCDLQRTGELTVALEEHELPWLQEEAELLRQFGHEVEVFDGPAMRAEVASPTYLGGVWDRTGAAVLDPGKLGRGLHEAALAAGVRIHEGTEAVDLVAPGRGGARAGRVLVRTRAGGGVDAARVILATGAHRSLLRAVRARIAPVYDYALMTEPLSAGQRAAIGWSRGQGIGDSANQFHYYRPTADGRILWGGYDAIHRRGGSVEARFDEHEPSFARLSQHFFTTFPQLRGLRFTHRWGGAIDTCSRFSVFFGVSHGGRVAHATGYTGLGVAATRFGARVALDLVDGRSTEATRLDYVARAPLSFPPEPLRTAAIRLTQNRLEAADARAGRRGLWLRSLDRMGLGFDS